MSLQRFGRTAITRWSYLHGTKQQRRSAVRTAQRAKNITALNVARAVNASGADMYQAAIALRQTPLYSGPVGHLAALKGFNSINFARQICLMGAKGRELMDKYRGVPRRLNAYWRRNASAD